MSTPAWPPPTAGSRDRSDSLWGCHVGAMYRRLGWSWHLWGAASATQPPFFLCTLTQHILCRSSCGQSLLLTRLLSLGLKVSPSQRPHSQCSKGPEAAPWPTCSHPCPTWAWAKLGAQQMLQGMNLPWGWGSSSTSLCPPRLHPQHLPQLPGGKGGWYPATTPNQHLPASSQPSPSGGERLRCRSSHPLVL